MTRWPGIQVLWLRVNGRPPSTTGFGAFTWCSEGIVPVGVPELPIGHFVVQAGTMAVVDFQDVRWEPLERDAFEMVLLEDEVGRRFRKTSKGTP